jgi:hypothetical protein
MPEPIAYRLLLQKLPEVFGQDIRRVKSNPDAPSSAKPSIFSLGDHREPSYVTTAAENDVARTQRMSLQTSCVIDANSCDLIG